MQLRCTVEFVRVVGSRPAEWAPRPFWGRVDHELRVDGGM